MITRILFLLGVLFFANISVNAQSVNTIPRKPIVNGLAIYLPKPEYPQEAKNFCADGMVSVEVEIDEKGVVIFAKAISGDELLRNLSVEAAKKAKFRITNAGGLPIKVRGVVVYNFVPEIKCIDVKRVVNERAKFLPLPVYPKSCRCTGNVIVQIVVDESGNVIRTEAIAGHPLLRIAAEKAARQAKFAPTFVNPGPIRVKALLAYQFNPDGTIETDIDGNGNSKKAVKPKIISCGSCGRSIFLPRPEYPKTAKAVNASGAVNVKIIIDEKGNVIEANAVSGHPFLQPAAVKAALKARFMPVLISGKPVRVNTTIVYNFVSP